MISDDSDDDDDDDESDEGILVWFSLTLFRPYGGLKLSASDS